MSAKLLYSLSEDNPSLQKQIGCMNGFLHLFDRGHLINGRSDSNLKSRSLPGGDNRHQGKLAKDASKRSKEKSAKTKETQGNSAESSRLSVSSTVSTTISSIDCDWSTKNTESSLPEAMCTNRSLSACRMNLVSSSPNHPNAQPNKSQQFHKSHVAGDLTTYVSSSKTTRRAQEMQQVANHVDSPRLRQPSRLDSPRLPARNDSFRSISSNQSAPVIPLRKKDPDQWLKDGPRLSYDGTETNTSSLKLRDLPRLSLDSRQRNLREPIRESKKDILLGDLQKVVQSHRKTQNLPEEPGSYRPPSSIVAKLMGLEALPDNSPSIKRQTEQQGSRSRSSDFLSRSSRAIDESNVNRVLHSPRNNCRESRSPRSNKGEFVVNPKKITRVSTETEPCKQLEGLPASPKAAFKSQEVNSEPQKKNLTVYGEIEKRLNDLDFKRSGKDLRALKQILESMHKEKTKQLSRKENRSSDCTSEISHNSPTFICQKQVPRQTDYLHSQDIEPILPAIKTPSSPRSTQSAWGVKPSKLIKGSRAEAPSDKQDLPQKNLQPLRTGKLIKATPQKKTTKHPVPETYHVKNLSSRAHCTIYNNFGATTPRPKTNSKAPQRKIKEDVTKTAKISRTVSTQSSSHTIANTLVTRKENHKNEAKCLHSQNGTRRQISHPPQDTEDQYSEFSADSSLDQGNTKLFLSESISRMASQMQTLVASTDQPAMTYDTLQRVSDKTNTGRISGDTSPADLTIVVREQQSPVSVLDANFYEDESPSPVKKKPTPFRDDESEGAYTRREWKEIDLAYFPSSLRQNICFETDNQRSTQAIVQLYARPDEITYSAEPNREKEYVSEILTAAGFLDDLHSKVITHYVYQSQDAFDSNLFFVLEQTKESGFLPVNRSHSEANSIMKTNGRHRQRLLFDMVNEILSQKLISKWLGSQTQLILKRLSRPITGGPKIVHEIYKEINQLETNSHNQSLNDEDEFLTNIIGNDLSHASGNWTNVSCEIPGLVLDIERLIFKDLIVELVHEEVIKVHAPKRGHR